MKNPRRNIPRAIRSVYIRLLLFYIGGVTVMGLLVSSNDSRLNLASTSGTAAASPFVIAINNAGIKVLPSVCILYKFLVEAPFTTDAAHRSSTQLSYHPPGLLQTATSIAVRGRCVRTIWDSFFCCVSTHVIVPDGLALNRRAPSIFLKTTSHGLPWASVAFSAIFGLLAFMGISTGSGRVFGWFVNM